MAVVRPHEHFSGRHVAGHAGGLRRVRRIAPHLFQLEEIIVKLSPYPPPRLVFWETTAGCNLACIHCRRITVADQLLPQDLTTRESFDLIDQIAEFARPIFVLSGGEPLFRPDIFDIARHASDAGL
ncbi:MAG: radical SAM protein, partial [Anaerolineae bacterium]|nr:radical SAM protein [Anaerolineae bacterium]